MWQSYFHLERSFFLQAKIFSGGRGGRESKVLSFQHTHSEMCLLIFKMLRLPSSLLPVGTAWPDTPSPLLLPSWGPPFSGRLLGLKWALAKAHTAGTEITKAPIHRQNLAHCFLSNLMFLFIAVSSKNRICTVPSVINTQSTSKSQAMTRSKRRWISCSFQKTFETLLKGRDGTR